MKIHWYLHKWQADNGKKLTKHSPISNPKPDPHNINAHKKFGADPLTFTQVIVQKWKDVVDR